MNNFLQYGVLLSLTVLYILANSADPDKMQHFAAVHLDLYCLLKHPFKCFQYTKGNT